jgi:16S rRNA (uracil1498-N3)-methyltransferase
MDSAYEPRPELVEILASMMMFFSENISSDKAGIILDEENSKHIVQVLRMKAGEKILLTDGIGNLVNGEIADAHKKHCTINIISTSFKNRHKPALTIGISLIKNTGRFEWFLEKATELGTAEIIPMVCDRTEKQHVRYDRLVSICKSAMLQSSQVWMPVMRQPASFNEVVKNAGQQQKLFGHISEGTNESGPAGKSLIYGAERSLNASINRSLNSHIILIGPEGDFSQSEVAAAKSLGFEGVSFGSTILRVETAGIYAAVVHAAGA